MCSSTSTPHSSATTSSTSSSTTPGRNSRSQATSPKEPAMTSAVSGKRLNANEVRTFEAPASLFENLQTVLVDLIELHLQGKQAHWNVVGTNFRDVHLQLDSIADIAREASDTIAERMRALDAVPDGRADTVVALTTVPAIPPGLLGATETVDTMTNRIY